MPFFPPWRVHLAYHTERRGTDRQENKALSSGALMDGERTQEKEGEALTNTDVTVSKKKGSVWACC